MNFKSYTDLNQDIKNNLHKLHTQKIDLVVGIPRSGMIPAYMIALNLNVDCIDLPSFIRNERASKGSSRKTRHTLVNAWDAQNVLLVDDSIMAGNSMRSVMEQLPEGFKGNYIKMAVYSASIKPDNMDLFFERVPAPRVFEWNIYHHGVMSRSCVDIDGVLCLDPTPEQNDDGPQYIDFLLNAQPLNIPSAKIHSLVTNRLEKYRKETETWLNKYNIEYDHLIMLNVASKEERQRLNSYATHKANYYRTSGLDFFVESEVAQASSIAQLTGKPVFCVDNNTIYKPGVINSTYKAPGFVVRNLVSTLKRCVPAPLKKAIKQMYRS